MTQEPDNQTIDKPEEGWRGRGVAFPNEKGGSGIKVRIPVPRKYIPRLLFAVYHNPSSFRDRWLLVYRKKNLFTGIEDYVRDMNIWLFFWCIWLLLVGLFSYVCLLAVKLGRFILKCLGLGTYED